MANMIKSLGRDWCNKRLVGGHFLYEGKLYLLRGLMDDHSIARDQQTGKDRADIPLDFFTGFKVFSYPPLGYRKYGPNLACFLKKRHSWSRGIRAGCLEMEMSPVTSYIVNSKYGREMPDGNFRAAPNVVQLAFLPQYDKPADIDKLLAGEIPSVVLSADVMVEPNMTRAESDDYIVYFRQRPCATITPDRQVHWYTKEYQQAIEHILRPRGSW